MSRSLAIVIPYDGHPDIRMDDAVLDDEFDETCATLDAFEVDGPLVRLQFHGKAQDADGHGADQGKLPMRILDG